MKNAKIAELKNNLSRYLDAVKAGGAVIVLDRDRPVAQQEPAASRRLQAARRELLAAWERWSEVTAIDLVRRHAERIVETHPLRAADALQLGAALAAAEDDPATLDFVTLDREQALAAEREGFRVLGP